MSDLSEEEKKELKLYEAFGVTLSCTCFLWCLFICWFAVYLLRHDDILVLVVFLLYAVVLFIGTSLLAALCVFVCRLVITERSELTGRHKEIDEELDL